MFFYLLHISPLWKNLENGKRNVRTFLCGIVCYILLHAYAFSSKNKTIILLRNYIWYMILADCFSMAATYRTFYGRSILKELTLNETDKFDKENHKWISNDQHNILKPNDQHNVLKHNIVFDNNSEKEISNNDCHIEKIKQDNPINKKRFNPSKNLEMMKQKHIINKNIYQFETDINLIKDNQINKLMSDCSGVENMPQDMTHEIINKANQDLEKEISQGVEIKNINNKTKASLISK